MKKVGLIILLLTSPLFGVEYFLVQGNSMYPSIRCGDRVMVDRQVSMEDLRPGDIVIFTYLNNFVVHRLIEISNNKFITKGDNNSFVDIEILTAQTLVGKVVQIPRN